MERRRLEPGAVRKDPGGRLRMALVYPNAYRLGMANLGLHAVYRIANAEPDVLCERAFLPDAPGARPRTVESGRELRDFDVSPDGRELVLEQVQEPSDVVLIDRRWP